MGLSVSKKYQESACSQLKLKSYTNMADENENLLEVSFKLGQAFPELKIISQASNCSICYRPFKSPTLTKCNHTFCSFCVRSYCSSGRQSCPICFKNIRETDFRSLKFLTEIQK